MVIFSVVFLSASLLLTRVMGSAGLVVANCINMITRILHRLRAPSLLGFSHPPPSLPPSLPPSSLYSCHYIHRFFQDTPHSPLSSSLPSRSTLLTFIAAFIITTCSEVQSHTPTHPHSSQPPLPPPQYSFCCDGGWVCRLLHVTIGAATLLALGIVVMTTEKELLLFLAHRLPYRMQTVLKRLGLVTEKVE